MELIITEGEVGLRPPVAKPHPDFYKHTGEEGIRKLVSDHYDLLVSSEIKSLFPQHPKALDAAKKHASDFFIQICGGPQYFNMNRGAPMMVKRHAPFKITKQARIVWLECYRQLITELDIPDQFKLSFWNYLDTFSKWMINSPKQHGADRTQSSDSFLRK